MLAGTGFSVIQNSGQAAWVPSESAVTSNTTVPVRPAKSNGCFGYVAWPTTPPPSLRPSVIRPLQIRTSRGGSTWALSFPQPTTSVAAIVS